MTPVEYYALLERRLDNLRFLDACQANVSLYAAIGSRIKSPKKRLKDYRLIK